MRVLSIVFFCAIALATAQESQNIDPEAAYVSSDRYTNAAFGFSLPLPGGHPIQQVRLKNPNGNQRLLLGAMVQNSVLTTFTILAGRYDNPDDDTLRKELQRDKLRDLKQVTLGGRQFWRGEATEKGPAGKMRQVEYVTLADGYLLKFSVLSFERKLTDEYVKCVEAITFFNPAQAKEVAGSKALFFPKGQNSAPELPAWKLDPGTVKGNLYSNADLGLEFQFPAGWTVNDRHTTAKVRDTGHQEMYGDDSNAAREHAYAVQCVRDLLYVTNSPAGTAELNPMVMLMALNPACGKVQFPKSLDDREALRAFADQITDQLAISPVIKQSGQKSRAFMLQGHLMVEVSVDTSLKVPGFDHPVPSHLSLLVTDINGTLVIWETATYSPEQLKEVHTVKIAMHK